MKKINFFAGPLSAALEVKKYKVLEQNTKWIVHQSTISLGQL